MKIQTDWSDLDAFDHINNVAIIRYMQSARVEACRALGIGTTISDNQPAFMVARVECDYLLPIKHPHVISIDSNIVEIGNSSFQFQHELYNSHGEKCATGRDVLVLFDFDSHHKHAIDDELREKMKNFGKVK